LKGRSRRRDDAAAAAANLMMKEEERQVDRLMRSSPFKLLLRLWQLDDDKMIDENSSSIRQNRDYT